MKLIALAIFLLAVTRVFGADAAADTIGRHYALSKVAALIAVDEHDGGEDGDTQYFEPLKTQFAQPAEVSKLCKAIQDSVAVEAGQGPFVGHLCHLVMVDKDQKILGMISILNFQCLCDINGAHRDAEGRIVADYEKQAFGFTSRELARALYDRLKRDDPTYMKQLDSVYADVGKTVEGLLFGNEPGEN